MEFEEIKITDNKVSADPCCVYNPLERQFNWVENEQTKDIPYCERRKKEKIYLTWIRNGGNKF